MISLPVHLVQKCLSTSVCLVPSDIHFWLTGTIDVPQLSDRSDREISENAFDKSVKFSSSSLMQ